MYFEKVNLTKASKKDFHIPNTQHIISCIFYVCNLTWLVTIDAKKSWIQQWNCELEFFSKYSEFKVLKVLQLNRKVWNSEYQFPNEIVVDCIISSCHFNWILLRNIHSELEFLHMQKKSTFSENCSVQLTHIMMLLTVSSISSWYSMECFLLVLNTNTTLVSNTLKL